VFTNLAFTNLVLTNLVVTNLVVTNQRFCMPGRSSALGVLRTPHLGVLRTRICAYPFPAKEFAKTRTCARWEVG
jgi:hypothetical protein